MGLRRKFALFALIITIISIFITATFGFYFNYQLTKKHIDTTLEGEVNLINSDISNWITEKSQVIEVLADIIEKNNLNKDQIYYLIKEINSNSVISDVYMGFEDGDFISAIHWQPPENYDPRVRPWYLDISKNEDITFSEPYLDITTGKYAVSIGKRVTDKNNRLIGILAEDILVDTLFERINQPEFNNIGYAFMTTSSGFLLAHPDKDIKNTDLTKNIDLQEMISKMILLKNGKLNYQYNNQNKITVFKQVPISKWIVGVAVIEKDVYHPLNILILQFVFVFLGVSLVALLISYKLSRNLVKRLNYLFNQTLRIADGNYDEYIEDSEGDEISALADSFNTMSSKIQSYVSEINQYNLKLEEKVAEAVSSIEEQHIQLKEAERLSSLTYLVSGIAHELNTPMGNSIMLASYIEKQSEDIFTKLDTPGTRKSEILNIIQDIRDGSNRLLSNLQSSSTLINDFKELSVDQLVGETTTIDLVDLIQRCQVIKYVQLDKNVVVNVDIQENLVFVSDYNRISKIFTELIENSYQHGFLDKQSGRIDIYIEESLVGDYYIRYIDDGYGIPSEILEHVFTPFFSTKFSSKHSGLGLNVVYNIVKSLNGNIKIMNGEKEGIVVEITLSKLS